MEDKVLTCNIEVLIQFGMIQLPQKVDGWESQSVMHGYKLHLKFPDHVLFIYAGYGTLR